MKGAVVAAKRNNTRYGDKSLISVCDTTNTQNILNDYYKRRNKFVKALDRAKSMIKEIHAESVLRKQRQTMMEFNEQMYEKMRSVWSSATSREEIERVVKATLSNLNVDRRDPQKDLTTNTASITGRPLNLYQFNKDTEGTENIIVSDDNDDDYYEAVRLQQLRRDGRLVETRSVEPISGNSCPPNQLYVQRDMRLTQGQNDRPRQQAATGQKPLVTMNIEDLRRAEIEEAKTAASRARQLSAAQNFISNFRANAPVLCMPVSASTSVQPSRSTRPIMSGASEMARAETMSPIISNIGGQGAFQTTKDKRISRSDANSTVRALALQHQSQARNAYQTGFTELARESQQYQRERSSSGSSAIRATVGDALKNILSPVPAVNGSATASSAPLYDKSKRVLFGYRGEKSSTNDAMVVKPNTTNYNSQINQIDQIGRIGQIEQINRMGQMDRIGRIDDHPINQLPPHTERYLPVAPTRINNTQTDQRTNQWIEKREAQIPQSRGTLSAEPHYSADDMILRNRNQLQPQRSAPLPNASAGKISAPLPEVYGDVSGQYSNNYISDNAARGDINSNISGQRPIGYAPAERTRGPSVGRGYEVVAGQRERDDQYPINQQPNIDLTYKGSRPPLPMSLRPPQIDSTPTTTENSNFTRLSGAPSNRNQDQYYSNAASRNQPSINVRYTNRTPTASNSHLNETPIPISEYY